MNELHCKSSTAIAIGAVYPDNLKEYRIRRDKGEMMIRDERGLPLFWPMQFDRGDLTMRSTQ